MTEMTREQETRLAEVARREARHGFKAGEVIPAEFNNPPAGSRGHLCVDPKGRYRPDWYSLKINKSGELGARQWFNAAGNKSSVMLGVWVDVPFQIIEVLEMCEIRVINMDISKANFVTEDHVPVTVDVVPRFNAAYRESA